MEINEFENEDVTTTEDADQNIDCDEEELVEAEEENETDASEETVTVVPKISASTIARTILMVLATVNLILTSTGHSTIPFVEEDVTLAVSIIFQVVMTLITWWKDNDFTKTARINKQKIEELIENVK